MTYSLREVSIYQKEFACNVLKEMFPDVNNTYVGIMIGNLHRTVPVNDLIKNPEMWIGKSSSYITGNVIKPGKKRNQHNVHKLNELYIDLDTNHLENSIYNNPVHAYYELKDFIKENHIPTPSLIVNTTRGLQLHWFMDEVAVTPRRLELWKKLELALYQKLSCFYPDRTVSTDCSRLLRLPYTLNRHTNELTEVLDMDGERYSLRYLKESILGLNNAPTKAQLNYISAIEKNMGISFPEDYKSSREKASTTISCNKFSSGDEKGKATLKQVEFIKKICFALNLNLYSPRTYKTANTFIREHIDEYNKIKKASQDSLLKNTPYNIKLEKINIAAMENYVKAHPNNDHCRENLLFLYRLAQLHVLQNEDLAWEKTLKLNKQYLSPFNERVLNRLTNSAVKYNKFDVNRWYGPNAIESKVVGDNDCESILPYFTRPSKRNKEKQKEYNHSYYLKKLKVNHLDNKRKKIGERQQAVRELREYGWSYCAIAKKLGVSVKTIQRDLKERKIDTQKKVDIFSSTNLLYNTIGNRKPNSNEPTLSKPVSIIEIKNENKKEEDIEKQNTTERAVNGNASVTVGLHLNKINAKMLVK